MSDERRDYAVLISLATREEAEVAAAALRADGVDAFIGNAHHAAMQWFHILALNGLQILVPRMKLEEAKALLQERLRENAAAEQEDVVRRTDRWKIWLIALWIYGPFAIALAYYLLPVPNDRYIPDLTWRLR